MVSKKRLTNEEFLNSVRDYWSMHARVQETDGAGKPESPAQLRFLSEHKFYRLNAEALSAFCHAIEDLALEEADGRLLAAVQGFNYFEPLRERYEQLALTIDQVELLGAGPAPRRVPRIRFIKAHRASCQDFRCVLYEGRRRQALVMGLQKNKAVRFDDKQFFGFYTFDPGVIGRVRRDMQNIVTGRDTQAHEFWRLCAIDQAAKQIHEELTHGREAVRRAVRRLQLEAGRYRSTHFASDLEKGLSRLSQWKTRMPGILGRAES